MTRQTLEIIKQICRLPLSSNESFLPVSTLYICFFHKCARIASGDEKDKQFYTVLLRCNSYSIVYIRKDISMTHTATSPVFPFARYAFRHLTAVVGQTFLLSQNCLLITMRHYVLNYSFVIFYFSFARNKNQQDALFYSQFISIRIKSSKKKCE